MHPRILRANIEEYTKTSFVSLNEIAVRENLQPEAQVAHRDPDIALMETMERLARLADQANTRHRMLTEQLTLLSAAESAKLIGKLAKK
jgi:hypothetical protein